MSSKKGAAKKPVPPERNVLQEWVKWQILTAGIFLIDGAIYAFKYPYPTFPPLSTVAEGFLGPVIAYGPSNTTNGGMFPFGPAVPVQGATLPLLAFIALLGALICLSLEGDFLIQFFPIQLHSLSNQFITLKAVFYGLLGLYCINQFTCIQPATFLIISSGILFYDLRRRSQEKVKNASLPL